MSSTTRAALCAVLLTAACGSTGNPIVQFTALAGGPSDASSPLDYVTGFGYSLRLDHAMFHLGAVYLDQSVPTSGAGPQDCILPGIYVGQAFGPLDLDLLSPALVPFPMPGTGTATAAHTGEVWLLEGDINATDSETVILDVLGTAEKAGVEYPFSASVTIGQNRAVPAASVAMPGANPICKKRIVTPISVDLTPTAGGELTLRVDPRKMFDVVDFSGLPTTTGYVAVIPDEKGGIGGQLFSGVLSQLAYTFSWE